jgi:hypothetical protein
VVAGRLLGGLLRVFGYNHFLQVQGTKPKCELAKSKYKDYDRELKKIKKPVRLRAAHYEVLSKISSAIISIQRQDRMSIARFYYFIFYYIGTIVITSIIGREDEK